ncbi:PREDICTED: DNA repair protein complementing XP-C cells homolog isoform X2 [Vollenhovia emeryi]|uniref:DNA repair protein complementing XP-C cells homolog isoform X2 n=1 Tax=Vollenhovia emeryi TaxID=411798 RepID=UPI0005F55BFE|nr:PREDICTED: DNA repair protein complementing XP-C cells homolog isoform X2 [Vollenhovia emeryi]
MNESDDDSSDSSNDFAGITPKDELTASFFTIKPATRPSLVRHGSEDESSDDETLASVPEGSDIELFSEVVRNLEASQRARVDQEEPGRGSSGNDRAARVEKRAGSISDEINAVLLQGESGARAFDEDDGDTGDEEEPEGDVKRPEDYAIPKEGVRITLPGTSAVFRKRASGKRESDLAALLRRRLKANQIVVEKAGRLCWLAYGFHLSRQACDPEVMATAVSLVSTKSYPKDNFDLEYLKKLTKWFKGTFAIEAAGDDQVVINKETLLQRLAEKRIYNYRELVILYVAVLRGIGLHCRLVVSLNPPLVKACNELLPKPSAAKKDGKVKEETKATRAKVASKGGKKSARSKEDLAGSSAIRNDEAARRNANADAKKKAAEILRSKYSYGKKSRDKLNSDASARETASTSTRVETASSSRKAETGPSPRRLRPREAHGVASTSAEQRNAAKTTSEDNRPRASNSKRQSRSDGSNSEGAEEPSSKSKRKCGSRNKVVGSKGKNEEAQASTDDEETDNKLRKRRDVWAEVYVESKASWICVNVMDGNVDCVAEIYKAATKPVLYVIAYNSESLIKDVTRRYCPQWLSVTRKQRIDEKWWTETLSYWQERETAMSRQEDELLLQKELEQPLPKTVGECKGHPLYVLVRHLLKYEALYPPDCVPLGHLKTGEAIYSRYCVHTLCSRETWLKKARVVKPKQEPYKIVKALPKYDKA